MAIHVKKNSPLALTLVVKDSYGVPITTYTPEASRISIKDASGNVYPITSVTWSGGYGQILVTTPDLVNTSSLSVFIDNQLISLTASPQVSLSGAYQGKFDLTGAVIAWDCCVPDAATDSLFDYSEHTRLGHRYAGGYFETGVFTPTSQYKVGPSGSLITPGYAAPGRSLGDTGAGSGPEVTVAADLTALCKPTQTDVPPIRTLSGVFWRSHALDSELSTLLAYTPGDATTSAGLAVIINNSGTTIDLVSATTGTVHLSYPLIAPNNIFQTANEIIIPTIRFTSTSSVSFFVNKVKVGDVAWSIATMSDGDTPILAALPSRLATPRKSTGSATKYLSVLNITGYSDAKSDAFIQANAASWGF